ncbi:MAG: glycoside hydrolase family 3 C-terminal domain-containing protein, partial [Lentisphaeria bacterium]|nr:glycoside hydrolase family 3 C-terminal domain-containing protein [Lentisphaeria bacterium]
PNADSVSVLLGNYNGNPSAPVTILKGIKQACGDKVEVSYTQGCPMALSKGKSAKEVNAKYEAAVLKSVKGADIVLFVGGINAGIEGEEMRGANLVGFNKGDRSAIELPGTQLALLKKLKTFGKPVILVNCSGSAMAMPWEAKNLNAVLQAWYPGQSGGTAVADILFGKYNPSGCLPVTFYNSTKELPPFEDYSMKNRTYRFFKQKPLFAFGHGLSYTKFKFSEMNLFSDLVSATGAIELTVKVKNTGPVDGEKVVQIYAVPVAKTATTPLKSLVGFKSVKVKAGETVLVSLKIPTKRLALWNEKLQKMAPQAEYTLHVASASDNFHLNKTIHITK